MSPNSQKRKIDKKPNPVRDRNFAERAVSGPLWFDYADDLHEAAKLLWKERPFFDPDPGPGPTPSLHRIALMLAGLALEGLFKARHVMAHNDRPPHTHELVQLAERDKVPLSQEEMGLLQRLTQFIMWSGRYPVPTGPEKHDTILLASSDWRKFDALYQRLRTSPGVRRAPR